MVLIQEYSEYWKNSDRQLNGPLLDYDIIKIAMGRAQRERLGAIVGPFDALAPPELGASAAAASPAAAAVSSSYTHSIE